MGAAFRKGTVLFMLCSRCKKRMAVVFVATNTDSKPQGLCAVCAKELGITQVSDMMEKMGITDEMLEEASEQFESLMNDPNGEQAQELLSMFGGSPFGKEENPEGEEDSPDNFEMGGAPTFPGQLQAFFQNSSVPGKDAENDNSSSNVKEKEKKGRESAKKKKFRYLNTYCEHLTGKARDGRLDRIIGRDREIGRVVQILSRRTKNNPCLIGEPGVGKTAIAEGLALRIVHHEVPQRLQKKEVYLLDLTALVAGTQFRGQFESRIKGLLEEVKSEGNIILFIDEVHNLVGTGDAEGTMSAANILKPALSRGEIQVIGATTFEEYRKYIEKDSALERRFQTVTIAEPSIEDAVTVLSGIKDYYENFHRVHISDDLIRKTVVLSERYINDRFLPDKAIDLLDEACTTASLRNHVISEHDSISDQLMEMHQREEELTADPENTDFEALATLRADIARLEQKEQQLLPEMENVQVTEEDIANVIELWTGIPASRVQNEELKRLANLEEALKKHIVGQEEAISAVAAAIRRSRVHISPRRRPASFIFVGPTGVGKTELVKVLSEELFDTPETLIRLDMSDFMEKHSVSRIIGSPPGYVGYDEAGQVTEKVRRRPYSVLLFDEIEKGHPDVLNILLQILDEGKITDAHGRSVNFENTVIIMTSNAGSEKRESLMGFGKTQAQASKEKALQALSEFLRPEFLSRIDEVVVFNPLTQEDFKGIAKLLLNEYVSSLKENRNITFTYSEDAVEWLAGHAFGGKSGARDLRNLIRREVEDKLASLLIAHGENSISGVSLSVDNNKLVLLSI